MNNTRFFTDEQYEEIKEKLEVINTYYQEINNRGMTFLIYRTIYGDELWWFDSDDSMKKKIKLHTIMKKVDEEYKLALEKFPKLLSMQLTDRDYRLGVKKLQIVPRCSATVVYDMVKLERVDDCLIRFRVHLKVFGRKQLIENANCVNLLKKMEVESVYYEVEMKPTDEEMLELYDSYYTTSNNKNTANLLFETVHILETEFKLGNFDIIFDYFSDIQMKWDVLDRAGILYRNGEIVDNI